MCSVNKFHDFPYITSTCIQILRFCQGGLNSLKMATAIQPLEINYNTDKLK